MNNILTYLFDVYAGQPNLLFWRSVMIGAGLLLAIAIAGIFVQKHKDKFIRHLAYRLSTWGFVSAPIMLLLAWFRYENMYFLSMRFWIFAWLLVVLVWLARILKWWFIDVPKARSKHKIRQKFEKYLPK